MNLNIDTDFPALVSRSNAKSCSKKRATRAHSRRSSISSMSTTSIGLERKTEKQTTQFLLENAVCRRHLFCKCRYCAKTHIGFTKKNWNDLKRFPCKKAQKVRAGTEVKVLHIKPYGNSGDLRAYVVSVPEEEVEEEELQQEVEEFKGWVHPDCINVVPVHLADTSRSAQKQKQRKRVARPVFEEKETLRVNETPMFRFREKVLCRVSPIDPWMVGDVVTEKPLSVRPENWEIAHSWEIENLKKFPQSKFIAVQSIPVRVSEDPKSYAKTTLPKGTTLGVVEMKGFEGRINEPVCGWVSMRGDHQLNVLELGYESNRRIYPTIYMSNLPKSCSSASVVQTIQKLGGGFSSIPKRVEINTMEDGRVCGSVSFSVQAGGKKLVNRILVIDGQEVYCTWCVNYLRYKAKQDLLRKGHAI